MVADSQEAQGEYSWFNRVVGRKGDKRDRLLLTLGFWALIIWLFILVKQLRESVVESDFLVLLLSSDHIFFLFDPEQRKRSLVADGKQVKSFSCFLELEADEHKARTL